MNYLNSLAVCLHELFTTTADSLGRLSGFIQRQRILSGSSVAQALVFSWMANPRASLESIACQLGIAGPSLQQHLDDKAHRFLELLLQHALAQLQRCPLQTQRLGLLRPFRSVFVDDCTLVSLPACLADCFPGCGGSDADSTAASLKIRLRYELLVGTIAKLTWHPGKTNDTTLAAQPEELPDGSLYLADLGFFDASRLQRFGQRVFWISRVPTSACVKVAGKWQPLWQVLKSHEGNEIDQWVQLVESVGLSCRLVALRCPQEVAARRRQKLRERSVAKKGRQPSERQLVMCDWTVLVSNVSKEELTAKEVWLVYRARWQVELLFKRAKQMAGWSFSHGSNGQRVQAEILAKILGLIVMNWTALISGGALAGKSAWKSVRIVVEYAWRLQDALSESLQAVERVLQRLQRHLQTLRTRSRRRLRPSTRDLLLNPELAP